MLHSSFMTCSHCSPLASSRTGQIDRQRIIAAACHVRFLYLFGAQCINSSNGSLVRWVHWTMYNWILWLRTDCTINLHSDLLIHALFTTALAKITINFPQYCINFGCELVHFTIFASSNKIMWFSYAQFEYVGFFAVQRDMHNNTLT